MLPISNKSVGWSNRIARSTLYKWKLTAMLCCNVYDNKQFILRLYNLLLCHHSCKHTWYVAWKSALWARKLGTCITPWLLFLNMHVNNSLPHWEKCLINYWPIINLKSIRFQNAYVNVTENYETLDEMPRAEMKDALRSFFTQCNNIIIQLVL